MEQRVRLRVKVVSLTDKMHVVLATAVSFWDGEILAQWSRVYRQFKKADLWSPAVLDAVAECKKRIPDAVVHPLDVIDPENNKRKQ
jgi:hypothetical protein